jgi:hypothetical protein
MKTLHTDDLLPINPAASARDKPVLAYAALGLAALLTAWVCASPRTVLGQSKAVDKRVASVATATGAAQAQPGKEAVTTKSKARLSDEELERLRAQILETSKQHKVKAVNK